ncbi:MAG: hypothetical protein WC551_08820 [Patescibacteria group bacterium]
MRYREAVRLKPGDKVQVKLRSSVRASELSQYVGTVKRIIVASDARDGFMCPTLVCEVQVKLRGWSMDFYFRHTEVKRA